MKDDIFLNIDSKYKYMIFNNLVNMSAERFLPLYAQIPEWQMDHLIRRELDEVEDKTALTAFLFARMNVLNVQLNQAINLLNQQPKEIQDFQRQQMALQQQQAIIQQQAAQIQQLQQRMNEIQSIFK
jgi:hypothetical protein